MLCYYIKSVTEPKMSVAKYSSNILQSNKCQVTEAIQGLPPELREIIYKHYLAIKLRERVALSWNLVHNELLKQPFCYKRQQIVCIIICLDFMNCQWEGLCYPCFERGIEHKLMFILPIENMPLLKICSHDYDWHGGFGF